VPELNEGMNEKTVFANCLQIMQCLRLPVKRYQNRSDVFEFWSLDNSSSKSILYVLYTIYLIFRKTVVQRVTVVKLGVYDGGGNCFCGVKVKVGTDTAESTNVMVAGFRQCRHLI